jgi:hypothetical protein
VYTGGGSRVRGTDVHLSLRTSSFRLVVVMPTHPGSRLPLDPIWRGRRCAPRLTVLGVPADGFSQPRRRENRWRGLETQ